MASFRCLQVDQRNNVVFMVFYADDILLMGNKVDMLLEVKAC